MLDKKKFLPLYFILILLVFFSAACSKKIISKSSFNRNPLYSEKDLLVHYIDVGQGDAILVQINNKNLLIDSGSESSSDKVIQYLKSQRVKIIDLLVATHPHEDHIGNMSNIINTFKVTEVYAPKKSVNSKSFEAMVKALRDKKLKINVAKSGVNLNLANNIKLEILAPINENYDDLNNYSAVIMATYGSTKFLFMGDAELLVENELMSNNYDLSADVLKIGHHGSKSSSSKPFLDRVSPSYAVISCGKRNDYGHPHMDTINLLKLKSVTTFRTDINKDILLKSDGSSIIKVN